MAGGINGRVLWFFRRSRVKIPLQGEQVNLTQLFWEQVEFLVGFAASENLLRRRRSLRVAATPLRNYPGHNNQPAAQAVSVCLERFWEIFKPWEQENKSNNLVYFAVYGNEATFSNMNIAKAEIGSQVINPN